MLRPFPLRTLVLVVVVAMFAAACGDGGADPSTTVVAGAGAVDSGNGVVPTPSGLIIDEDPHSPIAATLTFDAGDHPIERIDYLGPKPSTNLPPTGALVYLNGFDDALLIDLDASGAPSAMHLGDVGELRFEIGASEIVFTYVAPDGSESTEGFPLSLDGDAPEAMQGSGASATGMRVRYFDASVDVNRAVFTHVSVSSTGAPLPPDLPSPYLRIAGCHENRGNVTFACNRVPGQVIESHEFLRTHRLTMTHSATAVAEGVDPSIWPSAQACEAALGNDWWITEPLGVSLGTTATALGTVLLKSLAANPQAAAAGAAAGQGFLPAIALSGAVAFGFWAGNRAASDYLMGSETDCENIKRRVVALNMLGGNVTDMEFTIEVCLPPVEGWTFDYECQDIGPYRPFSSALETTPGDAASLDRNKLPPVEFIATADPGAVTGTIADAETGEPIAGATISLSEPGFETATDPAGSFTLDDVPAGPHGLSASAEGFVEATQPIHVQTGESTQVVITLDKADEEVQFPVTYEGGGEHRLSATKASGMCTIDGGTLRVTLHPDGTVTGTLASVEIFHTTVENDENNVATIVCLEPKAKAVSYDVVGTHEAQHVTLESLNMNDAPGESWLSGPFTSEVMTLSHTRATPGGQGDQILEAEYLLTPVQD